MAGNDRSTARLEARAAAGINEALAAKLEENDAIWAEKFEFIDNLLHAIRSIVSTPIVNRTELSRQEQMVVLSLAEQGAYWTTDLANDVNCFAEDLGCNHRRAA